MATGSSTDPNMSGQETDFKLCCVCQLDTTDQLIEKPQGHQRLLDFIRERATYGDKDFPALSRRLSQETPDTLLAQGATWHRSCYASATNKVMKDRAKKRFNAQVIY